MRPSLSVHFPLDKFAHDVRQPLRAIMLSTQRMQRLDPAPTPEMLILLEQVTAAARRQDALLIGAIDYDLAMNLVEQLEKPMLLSLVIEAACQQVEPFRKLHNGTLKISKTPSFYASPLVGKALEKLLHNALKFYLAGSEPVVQVEVAGDQVGGIVIRVTDTGIGIAKKYRESVFSPLTRLHGPDAYGGSGFGLSICRAQIESIQGTVVFEDSGGPCGVSAVVRLPSTVADQVATSV